MRSVHFRVEDDLYSRIQEEAEQQDLSVASFARVATIARALLWGVRRGAPWADVDAWGEAADIIQEIEQKPVKSASEAVELSEKVKKEKEVLLRVSSKGASRFVMVKENP